MGSTENQSRLTCSKERVNRAGNNFRNQKATEEDAKVLEKWRASHRQVLNIFRQLLRNRAEKADGKIVVAQRLKRKSTIIDKLRRHPKMKLSQMNDIAGCRMIFENIEDLYEFRKNLHNSKFRHDLKNEPDKYDYIKHPKNDGYRGVHDVYYYNVDSQCKGLQIEIQYRTLVQHSWATAVEVVGFVTENELKFGRGNEKFLEIFRFASEILSRTFENKKSCLENLSDDEVIEGFDKLDSELDFVKTLRALDVTQEQISEGKNMILMFTEEHMLNTWGFWNSTKALEKLFELERENPDKNIVFVRADKGEYLRIAFKNYFSDANDFTDSISKGRLLLSSKLSDYHLETWARSPLIESREISLQKTAGHGTVSQESSRSFVWIESHVEEFKKYPKT